MSTELILGVVIGLVIGALGVFVIFLLRAQRELKHVATFEKAIKDLEVEKGVLTERCQQVEKLEIERTARDTEIAKMRDEIVALQTEQARNETELLNRERAIEENKKLLLEAKDALRESFAELSQLALDKNNERFLQLAKHNFDARTTEANTELEKRKQAIEELVKPLANKLEEVNKHVTEVEIERTKAYTGIAQEIERVREGAQQLQRETGKLVTALRSPTQRGQWGEIQLKRAIELAGMIEYCDFETQVHVRTDSGAVRPDVVVKLPNDQRVIIDAKTPLSAYLDALEADDDSARDSAMKLHAEQVKRHIDQLSQRDYWNQFNRTPEFVIMFIPGEPIYNAALEKDPGLLDYGVNKNVLIVTPVSLIGLLRAAHYGWRHVALEENAMKIVESGKELKKRYGVLLTHIASLGRNLDSAISNYNRIVGSAESNVLPQLRRFDEVPTIQSAAVNLPDLKQIEVGARQFQSADAKGLFFEDDEMIKELPS